MANSFSFQGSGFPRLRLHFAIMTGLGRHARNGRLAEGRASGLAGFLPWESLRGRAALIFVAAPFPFLRLVLASFRLTRLELRTTTRRGFVTPPDAVRPGFLPSRIEGRAVLTVLLAILVLPVAPGSVRTVVAPPLEGRGRGLAVLKSTIPLPVSDFRAAIVAAPALEGRRSASAVLKSSVPLPVSDFRATVVAAPALEDRRSASAVLESAVPLPVTDFLAAVVVRAICGIRLPGPGVASLAPELLVPVAGWSRTDSALSVIISPVVISPVRIPVRLAEP